MFDLKHGIRITLSRGFQFGLEDIIAAVGGTTLARFSWKVQIEFLVIHYTSDFAKDAAFVAPLGDGYGEYCTERRSWSFDQILRLSHENHQVVDGEFVGYKTTPKGKKKWIVIKAFDSSWWDVWSGDEKVVDRLREAFRDTKDLAGQPAQ